jgi:ribosomal protein L2
VLNLNIKGQAQTQTLNNSKIETPYCYLPTKNTVDKKHLENKNNGRKPAIFSYILACDQLQLGDTIMNLENKKTQGSYKLRTKKTQLQPLTAALTGTSFKAVLQLNAQLTQQSSFELAKTETLNDTQNLATCPKKKTTVSSSEEATSVQQKEKDTKIQKKTGNFCSEQLQNCFEDAIQNALPFQGIVIRKKAAENDSSCSLKNVPMHDTFYQKPGNSIPLYNIAIGTFIYNIEINPGQGGKLVKAAGTFAQLVQQFQNTNQCLIRLPSGITKLLDSRCQATIGTVSNIGHAMRKLTKAGQNRWLGKRPVVRGVAMNPVDHPHGGGEGRTKGGRPSVSPWGKPTKGGFKTVPLAKKKKTAAKL